MRVALLGRSPRRPRPVTFYPALGLVTLLLASGSAASQTRLLDDGTTEPSETFELIQRTLIPMEPEIFDLSPERHHPEYRIGSPETGYYVPLLHIRSPLDFGIRETDPLYPVVDIALIVEQLPRRLVEYRVPSEVWAPHVARLEQMAISYIALARDRGPAADLTMVGSAVGEQTRAELRRLENALREHSGIPRGAGPLPGTTLYQLYPECCGGEVETEIETKPPGGRISYIPLFKFKLCEARGIDPFDEDCGWISAVKVKEFMGGKYRYVATWPDGVTRSAVLSVNDAGGVDGVKIVISQ